MKKTETKKDAAKKAGRKKADYGAKPASINVPKGMEKSTISDTRFGFKKFGDSLEGVFVRLEEVTGKGKSNLLHIKKDNGDEVIAYSSSGIEKHLEQNHIKAGDRIHIIFVDLVQLSNNRTWKKFDFYFKKSGKK